MGIREQLLTKIEAEVHALERELKVDLPRQLAEAAAHGDLSENAEHEAAKERKDMVEALLKRAYRKRQAIASMNVEMIPRDSIGFWSTVIVFDLDRDEEITYKLVSADESDPSVGRISVTSPIGRALSGHGDGDEVSVSTPRGMRNYEVLSFTTLHDDEESRND